MAIKPKCKFNTWNLFTNESVLTFRTQKGGKCRACLSFRAKMSPHRAQSVNCASQIDTFSREKKINSYNFSEPDLLKVKINEQPFFQTEMLFPKNFPMNNIQATISNWLKTCQFVPNHCRKLIFPLTRFTAYLDTLVNYSNI